MNRNGTAAIAGFGPVERDSKIRTTGSARHARVDITHGTPAKEERIKSTCESDKLSSRQRKSKRGKRENFVTVKCQKIDMETTYRFWTRNKKLIQINEC
ncbi:hypothetical protein [Enterobacter asburiae]|uniref:hypothetical protein n=1 Tax=Enterobacter asburiae TaxID=61645 RepID=UPI00287D34B9|nr:hypothetical protein [Enterobacter asburiae]